MTGEWIGFVKKLVKEMYLELMSQVLGLQLKPTSKRVLATCFERLPSATGNGPLQGPGATEPRARRTFLAL